VSLYDELEVASDATEATIKKAYRRKAKKVHPDAGGSRAAFDRLSHAVSILVDPLRREQYDKTGNEDDAAPEGKRRAAALGYIESHINACINAYAQSGFNPAYDPRKFDVVERLREVLGGELSKKRQAFESAKPQLKFLADVRKRFKRTKIGEDFIERRFEAQIRNVQAQQRAIEEDIAVVTLAIKMLEDYRYESDPSQIIMTFQTSIA
jgi:curved DNA-binding protein CbpA